MISGISVYLLCISRMDTREDLVQVEEEMSVLKDKLLKREKIERQGRILSALKVEIEESVKETDTSASDK